MYFIRFMDNMGLLVRGFESKIGRMMNRIDMLDYILPDVDC